MRPVQVAPQRLAHRSLAGSGPLCSSLARENFFQVREKWAHASRLFSRPVGTANLATSTPDTLELVTHRGAAIGRCLAGGEFVATRALHFLRPA